MESQNKRIRQHLESGKSITQLDALHLFNCFALSSRISELKKQGVNIAPTEMVQVISGGKKKEFARYKLAK